MSKKQPKLLIGWREWVSLPELGIDHIKAKIDTGARTSALHALQLEPFQENGQQWVRFVVKPHPKAKERIPCKAPVIDRRSVKDSGGKSEDRWVIRATLMIEQRRWPIELTLTDRSEMRFEMLLGRTAMRGKVQIDPGKSFLTDQD